MKKSTVKRLASLFLAMVMLVGAIAVEPSTVNAAETQTEIETENETDTENEGTSENETENKKETEDYYILLNQTKRTLYAGEYTTVKAKKVKNGRGTDLKAKSITYKSSNKKIATVTSNGIVKGIKAGKATITVTSKSNSKIKSKFIVTVKKEPKSVRRLGKSDMDISGLNGGGIIDEDTGTVYTNSIDYINAVGGYLDEFVSYNDSSKNVDIRTVGNPKTFITTRGIKLGSTKKEVLKKYLEKDREQAYKDKNLRKARMRVLRNCCETKEHKVKEYYTYHFRYKDRYYSIEFVFDQNDKVMAINY